MLSEITPEVFAKVTGVKTLPEKDFSIVSVLNKESTSGKFDMNEYAFMITVLNIFLK